MGTTSSGRDAPGAPGRTVLVRRSALGDVVLLGAVAGAIGGSVTVVTDRRYLGLVHRMRGVDHAIAWPQLPPGRVVDLQGSLRALRLTAHRRPRRIRKHSLRRRVRLRWAGVGPRPTVPDLYAQACGVRPVPPPWFDLPDVPRDTLALIPGAAWGPKRWASDRFAAVGRQWRGPVVVLGGPGEEALVEHVARLVPGAEPIAEAGFDATLDALARTAVAVAGDTGLMHLAGACGARVVALFGPTHPDDGFWVHRGAVAQRSLSCRPCALHRVSRCRTGDHVCLDLSAELVSDLVARCAG